ncbi:MAG: hypothetical protein RL210_2516 [Pseudomonadota bacterium]|jgi:hypothetical protein|nr:hypothetical protein [Pseudomonadota bacterium]
MKSLLLALSLGLCCAHVLAADASERKFIREGMSEAEVLQHIGKPDSESVDSGGGAKLVEKRWIYLPAPRDSQTLTTVTLRAGKVVAVSRQIAR